MFAKLARYVYVARIDYGHDGKLIDGIFSNWKAADAHSFSSPNGDPKFDIWSFNRDGVGKLERTVSPTELRSIRRPNKKRKQA